MRLQTIGKTPFKKMHHTKPLWWIFLHLVFTVSACVNLSAPPKPTFYYTLDYPSPSIRLNHQLPSVLRIERFAVSPPFNTQRIIYAGKGSHRNSYAYHQWIATPGELLPYFLTRDLRKTNGFRAVLTPNTSLSATHSLHGWVEEFIEKDGTKNCTAEATIHISLINNRSTDPTAKIMLQKRYHASERCNAKTPAALADAMSKVVAAISSAIAKDVHHRLSSAGTLKY